MFIVLYLSIPLSPKPWHPLISLLFLQFYVSSMSVKWDNTEYSLFRLTNFTQQYLRIIYVFAWLDNSFLFITKHFSIIWIYHICLTIYLLKNIFYLQFLVIISKCALNIYVHCFVFGYKFSNQLSKCPGAQLLDNIIRLHLAV